MNFENDDHKNAEYDRQSCPYICGRGSRWRKPCWQGPDSTGKCGDIAECAPLRRRDRYYCQRPQFAGGPCEEGPLPDGSCNHTNTPCRPAAGLRKLRRRITLLGLLLIISLITVLSNRQSGSELVAMINPGELSSSHSGFPVTIQCENCHQAHDKKAADWFMSAFEHQDLTNNCLQCHRLTGPEKAPHNRIYGNNSDSKLLECVACHQEHKGSRFEISQVSNRMCSNCHEQAFSQLSTHVKISENYPHQEPQNVYFDHVTHLGQYFIEKEWLEKANRDADFAQKASAACSTCHEIESANRDVPIRDYEKVCAGCHDHQIVGRALALLTAEEASPVMLGLITGDNKDPPDAEDAAKKLINIIAKKGIDGLIETIKQAGTQESVQRKLFNGLNPTALRATARAWNKEESFDSASDSNNQIAGWKTGENEDGLEAIIYQAGGHADASLKFWIELYLNKLKSDQSEHVEEAVEILLNSSGGPGACGKCHASLIGDVTRNEKEFKWGRADTTVREHTSAFNHRPHIDLLGNSEGCDACHKLEEKADYPAYFKDGGININQFESSFNGIDLKICTTCHNQNRVSDDCQLCHSYHRGVGFQFEYQKQEKERMRP